MSRLGLVDEAIRGIVDRIVDGTFSTEIALPPEADLAALLNVSRPTMREAVRSLSERGVLRVVHGRGTFVEPRERWHDLPTVIDVISRETSPRELGLQLTQVRRMIEVGASGLAATNRSDADVERMTQLLDQYDEASACGDVEATVRIDLDFHWAILDASGNPFLSTIMQPLSQALSNSRRITSSRPEVRDRAQRHHRNILDRIAAQDASGAKDAMRAHMTQTREDFTSL